MVEAMSLFFDQVYQAPSIVWTMAVLMGAMSGYLLDLYIEDAWFSFFSAVAMFMAIMIAQVAFNELGVMFTSDREANVVASAGAAVCSATIIVILLLRVWNAAADSRHRNRSQV